MSIDLTVIICTHNRHDLVDQAIASIEMQNCEKARYELIVVDNSTDLQKQDDFLASVDIACPNQVIVEKTPGLSRARNIGARAARGRMVAYMDDDARAPVDWVSEIVATFDRHAGAAVVGGPVTPLWPTSRPAWLHPWQEGFLTILDRGPTERPLQPREWLAGTNIAFRREPLIAAGLFEERLGRIGKALLSNEELAVTAKLRAAGHEVVYNPKMTMEHHVHADRLSHSWMRRRVFWQVVSDMLAESGPDQPFEEAVEKILKFQAQLEPKFRGYPSLLVDVDSAELFSMQLGALEGFVRLLASDARDWRDYLHAES